MSNKISDYQNSSFQYYNNLWIVLNDCYNEDIKAKGETYLPKTSGMENDTKSGNKRYLAYKRRGNYFNNILTTVTNSTNAINRRPAIISELPESLEYLTNKFNSDNEKMLDVLNNVYNEQMKLGRVGYLGDYIVDSKQFEAVEYKAPYILDFGFERRKGLKRVVYILLSETSKEINDDGVTKDVLKYRILGLDRNDNYFTVLVNEDNIEDIGKIKKFTAKDNNLDFNIEIINNESKYSHGDYEVLYPNVTGRMLHYIPFKIANARDTKYDFSSPPLNNQSNLSISLYNASANHEHLVYMQSPNLLLLKGVSEEDVKGMGGIDGILQTENENADGNYIGVDGSGLAESRASLGDLKNETVSFGTDVATKMTQESEKSLQSRIMLQTEKLKEISVTGGNLIEFLLQTFSEWNGDHKSVYEKIKVKANTNFKTEKETADELEKMAGMWARGEITDQTYYDFQFTNGYVTETFEDWLLEILKKRLENKEVDNKEVNE